MLLLMQGASLPESEVAGRALQVGVDRQSSLAFKGAGTETNCCQERSAGLTSATFKRLKFRTTDGFGAMHIDL